MEESLIESIQADAIFKGIKNIENEYSFYYDESNNFRKLILKEQGLNTIPSHFSLGGIVKKKDKEVDPKVLLEGLNIQKSSTEIKSNQIFKGEFPLILKSRNLKTLLKNILDSDYLIHISIIDPFYYSIVDIIDSVLLENSDLIIAQWEIKDFVYLTLKNEEGLELDLYKLNYPNIKNEDLDKFKFLISNLLIKSYKNCKNPQARAFYKAFTDKFRQSKSLEFIQDNKDNVLIESLYHAYSHNTLLYKNSSHIFDIEKQIEPEFSKFKNFGENVQTDNYCFVDSKDLIELQVSDVIAGLFAKYHVFIDSHDGEELKKIKSDLTGDQKECLDLITKLINKSDNESSGLLYKVISIGEQIKNDFFIHSISYKLDNYIKNK